ncbi:hypothetical protein D3C80_1600130 [compost metagenome]
MQLHVGQQAQPLKEQLRLVQQSQAFLGYPVECTGLVNASHLCAGSMQLARYQWQQGASAGNQSFAQWFYNTTLDLQLQATEQDHAR